jgi:predicted MFS family arabinose efflux permease
MGDFLQQNRRMLAFLLLSNFALYFGFNIWQTMFNNFAVEELGVGPLAIGWIQAIREVPGLLGVGLGLLSLYLSEVRLMAASTILLGVGLYFTGQSHGLPLLLVSTIAMSIGFHFFYPCSNAVVLMSVEKQQTPKTLGLLGSLGSVAAILANGIVFLFAARLGYRNVFMLTGGLIVLVGVSLLFLGKGAKAGLPLRRRVVFRKRYWLYYTLSFLMGSRRHIFTTFAIYLLVREYGVSVQTTATLFLITSVISVFALRVIGHLIGKVGEKLILSLTFAVLMFVFAGYAFINFLPILYVFFVADNVLFGFEMARSTYFQKIALNQEEITSNVAVEQTINHIAAVVVPVVGGAAWEAFGSQIPFLVGIGIVFTSLILTQFMRIPAAQPVAVPAAGGE